MSPQLKKGFLEYCILAVLERGDSYGYQIIKDLAAVIAMPESTLYPILKRLEKQGKVTCHNELADGRNRKYYHLTAAGRADVADFLQEQTEVERIYQFIRGAMEHA